jgi:hypothetical protein
MTADLLGWLQESGEPCTRYRTLVDLLGRPSADAEVRAARAEMLAHPQVREMITQAAWPGPPLKRHNDAGHPLYKFSTLADFGVRIGDPIPLAAEVDGLAATIEAMLSHQAAEGAFQTLVAIPSAFGGANQDTWAWMACDAPTLLYGLLASGPGDDQRVRRAVEHLAGLVEANGWRCVVAPELGRFRGPGRKTDPCPVANVYALKALSQVPEWLDSPAARAGAEMLLRHWEQRQAARFYLFGTGTDFRKLKYPFVWYDILHVADVLSRFPFVRADSRFRELVATITDQADESGRYTAGSMYQAWTGWSFADKKHPSPWLTFLVLRILKRADGL